MKHTVFIDGREVEVDDVVACSDCLNERVHDTSQNPEGAIAALLQTAARTIEINGVELSVEDARKLGLMS